MTWKAVEDRFLTLESLSVQLLLLQILLETGTITEFTFFIRLLHISIVGLFEINSEIKKKKKLKFSLYAKSVDPRKADGLLVCPSFGCQHRVLFRGAPLK
mmetsp:Transcript_17969/g.23274  ORF Transcript_17969/g.23274 Transcript_17969/m.23274 type:complete len:100 (+) Transcript_17969:150-449(+)